jgi:RimJ/RimL family protein N-acetyltransferase
MSPRLVPLEHTHADALDAIMRDPDVIRFTPTPRDPPPGLAAERIGKYVDGRKDGTRDAFAIVDDDGTVAGVAVAPHIDRVAREAELGYMVGREARGRGVATEGLALLTRWAFEEVGILRAYLLINIDNDASRKVAERCGYRLEGVMRSKHLKGDIRIDTELWSRLPSDPAPPPAP